MIIVLSFLVCTSFRVTYSAFRFMCFLFSVSCSEFLVMAQPGPISPYIIFYVCMFYVSAPVVVVLCLLFCVYVLCLLFCVSCYVFLVLGFLLCVSCSVFYLCTYLPTYLISKTQNKKHRTIRTEQ